MTLDSVTESGTGEPHAIPDSLPAQTDLDRKLNQFFGGSVVRKDLVKAVKGNAIVPSGSTLTFRCRRSSPQT